MDSSVAASTTLDYNRRLFTEAQTLTENARNYAEKASRYYHGKLDKKIDAELRLKMQPNFNINRVKPAIEGMIGVVDKGKSDPRCYPRTPKDEDSSEVATDTLRYICDTNRWHSIKINSFRNILVEGTAAILTEVDGQLDIKFRRIRFEEFFYDPYSRELDFSDASYMGIAKWQYVADITKDYPEHEEALRESCYSGSDLANDSTWNDRPNDAAGLTWYDSKRKRLLRVEMYSRTTGVWQKCVFVGNLVLEEGDSPYLDNDKKPCNPIEAYSAYIDDENRRYGEISDMMGPQDEINVYRRQLAHLAKFRQMQEISEAAAYADKEEVRAEAAKADGVIPAGYGPVGSDKFELNASMLAEAKGEIDRVAPAPALLGRQSGSQSGRQSLIQQQAGLMELAHLFSGTEDFELRCYRQAWSRARQYWNQPKFLRVTDDEKSFRFVQVNKPMWGPPEVVMDPETGFWKVDSQGQIVMEPKFLGMENAIAEMDVDIIVDSTPDTANVQEEQFQALVELAKVYGPQEVAFDDIVAVSSMPRKREFTEKRDARRQQQSQTDPLKQQAAALELQSRQADIGKTVAQTEQSRATAIKTMADVHAAQSAPAYFPQG